MRAPRRWLAAALAAAGGLLVLGAALPPLPDLAGHPLHAAVAALAVRGVVAGFPDGTFRPNDPVTRGQLARLLVGALAPGGGPGAGAGAPAGAGPAAARGAGPVGPGGAEGGAHAGRPWPAPSRFADLTGHWALPYAEDAAERGVLVGYPDGTFRPDRPVTRAEAVVAVARAARLRPGGPLPYADADRIPPWAAEWVAAAVGAGLTRDLFGDRLDPARPATRAEVAALAFRLLAARGALHDLAGTVRAWDPDAGRLEVETPAGPVAVRVPPEALTFRQGVPSRHFWPLDQVWVVLAAPGQAAYVEARYSEVRGHTVQVQGDAVRFFQTGTFRAVTVRVLPWARVFLNGQPAALAALQGAQRIALVLDAATGAARLVDAVRYTHRGTVQAVDPEGLTLTLVSPEGQVATLAVAPDARLVADGGPLDLAGLAPGVPVVAYAPAGTVLYLEEDVG